MFDAINKNLITATHLPIQMALAPYRPNENLVLFKHGVGSIETQKISDSKIFISDLSYKFLNTPTSVGQNENKNTFDLSQCAFVKPAVPQQFRVCI